MGGSSWYYGCCGQRSMDAHAYRSEAPSQVEDHLFAEWVVVPEREPKRKRVRGPVRPVGQQADVEVEDEAWVRGDGVCVVKGFRDFLVGGKQRNGMTADGAVHRALNHHLGYSG